MPVISLDVHVDDLDAVLALFDKVQVWRSETELGTYAEITAASDLPAKLTGTVVGPWALSGKTLTITLNNADPINVTFTGTDPLPLNTVLQKINSLIPALATESGSNTGLVMLTSPVLGTGSALQVSGNAAAVLGLSTTKVNGFAARISLVNPTTDYSFRDYDGDETFWYKTRYFSTVTGTVSSFSDPRQGNPQVVLPASVLSKAIVNLVDGAGRPVVKRRIIFVPTSQVLVNDASSNLYGSLPGVDRLVAETDEKGNAEIDLVRGQTFRVFLEGTSYQREFVVPNASNFNLFTVLSTAPDPLSIVQAPPRPIRTS